MPQSKDASRLTFLLSIACTLPPRDGSTAYEVKILIPGHEAPHYVIAFMRETPNGRSLSQLVERMPRGHVREIQPLNHPFTACGTPEQFQDEYGQIRDALETFLLEHETRHQAGKI